MLKAIKRKTNIIFTVYFFLIAWNLFFVSSSAIRPNATIFWPAMLIVGLFVVQFFIKIDSNDKWYFIAIIIMVISLLYTDSFSVSLVYTIKFTIFYLMAKIVTKNTDNFDIIIKLFTGFSIVMMIVTYVQFLFPDFYISNVLPLLNPERQTFVMILMRAVQYCGFTVQTGMNASFLSFGICLIWVRTLMSKKHRIINIVLVVLLFIALILTQKRSFTILTIVFTVFFFTRIKKKNKFLNTLLFVSIIAAVTVMGSEYVPGLTKIISKFQVLYEAGDITYGRIYLSGIAIDIFKDKPLFGIGINSFSTIMQNLYGIDVEVHNSFLQILTELGIFGVVFFFIPHVRSLIITARATFSSTLFLNMMSAKEREYIYISLYYQAFFFVVALVSTPFQDPDKIFILMIMQMMVRGLLKKYDKQLLTKE